MMVDNHYDDEVLIAMLAGDADSVASDPHLAACDACRGILDNVRSMSDALADECVWDRQELSEAPVPETIHLLRTTAARMDAEDAEAERCLAELLAGPRETWMPRLEQHPEWRTAGVVRRLVARADNEVHMVPLDVLEMAKMAVAIAGRLRDSRLVAASSRAVSYAQFFTGDFSEALSSLDRADEALTEVATGIADYDGARQMLVRALILNGQEQTDKAISATQAGSGVFARFGDQKRWLYGTFVSAMIEYSRRNVKRAISLFERIEEPLREMGDLETLAGVRHNLAFCYSEEHRFGVAGIKFMEAMALFKDLNLAAEAARARWNMAIMQLHNGQPAVALTSLLTSQQELTALGMMDDAVCVSLEIIEAQLALGYLDDAAGTAHELLQNAQAPSLAAAAVGYLRELSSIAAPQSVQRIRSDIRRLRDNRQLLFAPPPD